MVGPRQCKRAGEEGGPKTIQEAEVEAATEVEGPPEGGDLRQYMRAEVKAGKEVEGPPGGETRDIWRARSIVKPHTYKKETIDLANRIEQKSSKYKVPA